MICHYSKAFCTLFLNWTTEIYLPKSVNSESRSADGLFFRAIQKAINQNMNFIILSHLRKQLSVFTYIRSHFYWAFVCPSVCYVFDPHLKKVCVACYSYSCKIKILSTSLDQKIWINPCFENPSLGLAGRQSCPALTLL